MQTYVPRTKPKPKPSADMPPEVRRLRAFLNNVNDAQARDARFAYLTMVNAQFMKDVPRSGARPSLSEVNRMLAYQTRMQRLISASVKLPYRVLNDMWRMSAKPRWEADLTPVQMEILYGPET